MRRLHLLDGLLIAYSHLDEIIAILREADRPKPVLVERFHLSDEQAEAILELRCAVSASWRKRTCAVSRKR